MYIGLARDGNKLFLHFEAFVLLRLLHYYAYMDVVKLELVLGTHSRGQFWL